MRQLLALLALAAVAACAHAPSTLSGKWVRDDVTPAAVGSTCPDTMPASFEFAVSTVTAVAEGKTQTMNVKYGADADGKSIEVVEYSASGDRRGTVVITPNDDDKAILFTFPG